MAPFDAIKQILPAFKQYYTIKTDPPAPFCAEAEFRSHNEQYFLVRSAHIADIDSNEFVYFAECNELTPEGLKKLVAAAWNEGLAKVHPHEGHRNSDVSLLVFATSFTSETEKIIKKTKLYKSYKFSFHGWSNFKLAVYRLSDMAVFSNRLGKDYKKLIIKNIKNPL